MFKKINYTSFLFKEKGFVLIQFLASIAFFIALLSSSMSFFSLLKARKEANRRNQRINSTWELEVAGEQYQHSLLSSAIRNEDKKCLFSEKTQEENREYVKLTCQNENENIKINQVVVIK
jgi:hypothetical protein